MILHLGDKVHFSVPIGVINGRPDVEKAREEGGILELILKAQGIIVLGWSANTGLVAPVINLVIRDAPTG